MRKLEMPNQGLVQEVRPFLRAGQTVALNALPMFLSGKVV